MKTALPNLAAYPFQAYDKLRYADTDRQGHVNNAVFSTLLETGRTEFLLNPERPLNESGCGFVIARLEVDYWGEITWPGRVEIGTRIVSVGRSSMTLEQGIFQHARCVATAQTVIVQMNESTRKSHPLSAGVLDYLKALIPPNA
jgi:acyl-CoA thioester hydrolase